MVTRMRSTVINPRRACAARVTVVGLCVCVCLSVYDYSRTAGCETAYERYQQFQPCASNRAESLHLRAFHCDCALCARLAHILN